MLAWRIISYKVLYNGYKVFQQNETQFTSNPDNFCRMFKKFLNSHSKKINWDETDIDELNREGTKVVFKEVPSKGDGFYVYAIETAEISV